MTHKSIEKVNIGGLPFLPSAVSMVTQILDELISDSPESAFERATLPRGIEEKLLKVDWSVRDVLVGSMRNKEQLNTCLQYKFYHIPASRISENKLPIHTVALYQSKTLFGSKSGIRYYGDVIRCSLVPRNCITEIPSDSEELYYRLDIKEWRELSKPILPKEVGGVNLFTNRFLLEHSSETPELRLRSEEEYRLYTELKRRLNDTQINDSDSGIGFRFGDYMVAFEDGKINVYSSGKVIAQNTIEAFSRSPNAVFRLMQRDIQAANV